LKIKSQRDFWAGVMFVGTGVVFALAARHHPLGDSAEPGPGTITLLLSVVMVILGAIVGFKALTIEADDGDPIGAIAWRPLLAIVSAVVVFAATITRLGLAFAQQGKLAEASREFERASRDDPRNAGALTQLGISLIELGRPAEAIPHLETAVRLDPASAVAQRALSRARDAPAR